MAEYDMSGVVREKVDEKVTSRHSCSRARMHTLIYFGCDRSKAHIKQLANHALAKNNMGQQKKHDPSKVMPIFGSNPNLPKKKNSHPQIPKAKHVQVAAALAVPSHRPVVPRPSSAFNGIPWEGLGIGFCADSGHLEHQQRMGVGLELELVIHTALDLHLTRTVNQDCKQ